MYKFFVKSNQIKEKRNNINNEKNVDNVEKADKTEKTNDTANSHLIATIIGEDVNHIANVLRLAIGESLIICNKDTGISYNATISKISQEFIECTLQTEIIETTECPVDIDLFQGLPKSDKMEYIIQKTTELGVKNIFPVEMERCVVKLDSKSENKKIDRWNKIAESAAKQSKRDIIPEVKNIINLENICKNTEKYDIILLAYENEEKNTLKNELQKLKNNINIQAKGNITNTAKDTENDNIRKNENIEQAKTTQEKIKQNKESLNSNKLRIGVVVGPEGGLSTKEVDKLISSGAKCITLGKRILRTETAPIVIISNIIYEFEM